MARVSHSHIINVIRGRITEGEYRPGDRLPTRPQIEAEFGASIATVQKALSQLANDGFVVARGRSGTFVTKQPPHLFRIGVLLPGSAGPQMHEALRHVADQPPAGSNYSLRLYRAHAESGALDTEALIDDIRQRRLAGLITCLPLANLTMPEDINLADLPSVYMGQDRTGETPSVGWTSILPRAAEQLANHSRSRVAVLRTARVHRSDQESHRAEVSRALQNMGLRAQDRLLVPVQADAPDTTRGAVRLLMALPQQDRPDAMIILDDRLAGPATEMLQALDVQAERSIEVIVASYFPRHVPLALPATRMGCDVPAMVASALTMIRRQQQGEIVAPRTEVPAVYEHECLSTTTDATEAPTARRRIPLTNVG